MFNYIEFIADKYNFQRAVSTSPNSVVYTFRNKDGILFEVSFWLKSFFDEEINDTDVDTWVREYKIVDNKHDHFQQVNKGDAFSIIKTVTDITIEFINKYKPNKITIEHIPTEKELDKVGLSNYDPEEDYATWSNYESQRALINKRFLEKNLPKNYRYKLSGIFSYITRK